MKYIPKFEQSTIKYIVKNVETVDQRFSTWCYVLYTRKTGSTHVT